MADLSKVLVRRITPVSYDKQECQIFFEFVVPNCVLRKLRLIGPKFLTGVIDLGFEEFTWHSRAHFARLAFRIGDSGETDDLKLVLGGDSRDGVGSMHIYTSYKRTLYVRLNVNCKPDDMEVLVRGLELEVTTMPTYGPPPTYQAVTVAGQTWRHSKMRDGGNNMIINSDGCLVFRFQCGG